MSTLQVNGTTTTTALSSPSGSNLGINTAGGNVGIGTTTPAVKLQVVGDIRVGSSGTNGCVQQYAGTALTGTCSSDERLKTNIKPLGRVLDRLTLIEPSTYHWRADEFPERHYGPGLQLGVIAQQVQKHMPELVEQDSDGFLKVHFGDLPIYLLEGLRDLKTEKDAEITQLKARADKAEAESATLRAESASLKAQVLMNRAHASVRDTTVMWGLAQPSRLPTSRSLVKSLPQLRSQGKFNLVADRL